MRCLICAVFAATLVLAACSDDETPAKDATTGGDSETSGDGATKQDQGTTTKDATPWPDKTVRKDTAPVKCSATSTSACGGKKNMYCDNGYCKDCPDWYYNCDRLGDCECLGACDGAKCVGTSTKCKFDDKNVCGGDQSQYCGSAGSCVSCPKGTFNCDKTKDCECTTKCVGTKCQ